MDSHSHGDGKHGGRNAVGAVVAMGGKWDLPGAIAS